MKKRQLLLFVALVVLMLALGANVAAATTSLETTTSVGVSIKLSAKTTVAIPAGSNVSDVKTILQSVDLQVPSLYSFGVTFKDKTFKAPALYVARASKTMVAAMKRTMRSDAFALAVFNVCYAQSSPTTINMSSTLVKLAVRELRASEVLLRDIYTPIARQAFIAPRNMEYIYSSKKKTIAITSARNGYKATKLQIKLAFIEAYINACDRGVSTLKSSSTPLTPLVVVPRIATKDQMGKCVLVDKSQRRLFVYSRGRRTSVTYRVTVGMSGHTTPSGTFKIGAKRYLPSWGNPGSAWAENMPARIAPGPNNPLGLRAMNINTLSGVDTGLRIHGTSNLGQIGTASSHGCVRVYNTNIVKLYPKISTGDRVVIQP